MYSSHNSTAGKGERKSSNRQDKLLFRPISLKLKKKPVQIEDQGRTAVMINKVNETPKVNIFNDIGTGSGVQGKLKWTWYPATMLVVETAL